MRECFSLEKQITHLFKDKSVVFELSEIKNAEEILRDTNYHNFVSCSKVKFAELIGGSMIMYKTATFKDWKAYFEMDQAVSKHLMGDLIDFELKINSRVSHYISEMMHCGELTDYERNEIIVIISQMRDRSDVRFSKYMGQETWTYVSKMTFGEMKRLLFWLYDNKYDIYLQIVKEYSFLSKKTKGSRDVNKDRWNEINGLRNSLFHFTSIWFVVKALVLLGIRC